jgi:hypothetical protein
MSDVAVVLRKARDLYAANPSHVAPGKATEPDKLCVYEALSYASDTVDKDAYWAGGFVLRESVGRGDLAYWNAENSTETVLAAFDKAITEADNA